MENIEEATNDTGAIQLIAKTDIKNKKKTSFYISIKILLNKICPLCRNTQKAVTKFLRDFWVSCVLISWVWLALS